MTRRGNKDARSCRAARSWRSRRARALPRSQDHNLLRISQYVGAARGEDELCFLLQSSRVPAHLAAPAARACRTAARRLRPAQLVAITTNYDDLLEVALAEEGLDFDVVWYEAKLRATTHGRFLHRAPGKKPAPIARPNKYTKLPIKLERPAILKLHGCTIRESAEDDSYVITEDSYIDYLASGGDLGALSDLAVATADEQQPPLPRLLPQ